MVLEFRTIIMRLSVITADAAITNKDLIELYPASRDLSYHVPKSSQVKSSQVKSRQDKTRQDKTSQVKSNQVNKK